MLEFFENYGADLIALIIAICGAVTATMSLIRVVKLGKQTKSDIQITKDGIVEGFKMAKIPSEWKVSISNQVDKKLQEWTDKFIEIVKENEELRTRMTALTLKILSYTQASNKLTEEEKAILNDLIKLIKLDDATIDITE